MFRFTICDPLIRDVIDKGTLPKDGVLPAFRDFRWSDMLAKMRTAKESDICFSPSVEFTNLHDGHSFVASIVEAKSETVFYLFYKESPTASPAEVLDQSAESTVAALGEFVDGHYERLRGRFAMQTHVASKGGKQWWRFW
jgi:hypothetical protein